MNKQQLLKYLECKELKQSDFIKLDNDSCYYKNDEFFCFVEKYNNKYSFYCIGWTELSDDVELLNDIYSMIKSCEESPEYWN